MLCGDVCVCMCVRSCVCVSVCMRHGCWCERDDSMIAACTRTCAALGLPDLSRTVLLSPAFVRPIVDFFIFWTLVMWLALSSLGMRCGDQGRGARQGEHENLRAGYVYWMSKMGVKDEEAAATAAAPAAPATARKRD